MATLPTDIADYSLARLSPHYSFAAVELPAVGSSAAVADKSVFLAAGCLASGDGAVEVASVVVGEEAEAAVESPVEQCFSDWD